MLKSIIAVILLFVTGHATTFAQETMSPAEYLGYELGERVTYHHRVTAYFEHVAATSPMVRVQYYGRSYGERPLMVAYVTSSGNLERLEEIRTNNLKRAKLMDGQPTGLEPKALVWFSYNVHGNEISGMEASMQTLYELATKPEAAEWLENTVVIMDPALNPDGRDRYANWFHQTMGKNPDPYPTSREHIEPWPNGRTNHYHFDLNRDWAWQIQRETRQRLELYHNWMPHVHVDFHEMGVNNPYYFAPAAEPLHEAITQWQREFQAEIGRNNARYFDKNFRVYYTRENFDLYYPSYGDTYPTYNGAIGMTYEQAGNTRGGISVVTPDGDTLNFDQRILNQHIAGMSTIEVSAKNHRRLADEFAGFFAQSAESPYAPYKTYVIKGSSGADKLSLLTQYLDKWEIQYGKAPARRSVNGYDYKTGNNTSFSLSEEDLIISAHQPKSVLLNVLFEPKSTIIDSLTYDITAWSVPYAMGLDAFAVSNRIEPREEWGIERHTGLIREDIEKPYAYVAKWESLQDVRFLSELLNNQVLVRYAMESFEIDDHTFKAGSLIIPRRGNELLGEHFDELVLAAAENHGRSILPTTTGLVTKGIDFGSSSMVRIHPPKIALLGGSGVSVTGFGEVWHFFDRQIDYPVSTFNAQDLGRVDLNDFDVLVLPAGRYRFSDSDSQKIETWVRSGGRLIAIGSSVQSLGNIGNLPVPEARGDNDEKEPVLIRYEDRRREALTEAVTGSIYRLTLDNSHPLAFGYPDYYYTLKSGSRSYELLKEGWNVGRLHEGSHLAGFEGYKAAEKVNETMIFGTRSAGSGTVVYLVDNPLFRGFWHNGKVLFSNAVFFIGQ